jgi:hypothetical protein
LDKYSTDIREAVESLLEQDEEMGMDPSGQPEMVGSENLEDGIPLGAASDGSLEEQEIVIDFKDLKAMAEQLTDAEESAEGGDPMGDQIPHPTGIPASSEIVTTSLEVTLEEETEFDLDDLDELVEELVVDIHPQKSGWAATPEPIMDFKAELELARRSGTEANKQITSLTKAGERLSEANNALKAKNAKMLEALQILKNNFNKTNLSNARLVYTNKVLTDTSLNERQKTKIVEALSKSDSIEEAKVIFETLKSAVGSVTGKARPQSLRETIERPSATLPRRASSKTIETPVMERMKILAGIKK